MNLEMFFSKELPGLPPQREIDFETEVVPGAQPSYLQSPISYDPNRA